MVVESWASHLNSLRLNFCISKKRGNNRSHLFPLLQRLYELIRFISWIQTGTWGKLIYTKNLKNEQTNMVKRNWRTERDLRLPIILQNIGPGMNQGFVSSSVKSEVQIRSLIVREESKLLYFRWGQHRVICNALPPPPRKPEDSFSHLDFLTMPSERGMPYW